MLLKMLARKIQIDIDMSLYKIYYRYYSTLNNILVCLQTTKKFLNVYFRAI